MHANPALVLNADFRPLSYFPLSLIPWQDAVSALITDKISVVAEYDIVARSPSTEIRLPSVVALRQYQPASQFLDRGLACAGRQYLRSGSGCLQRCQSQFEMSCGRSSLRDIDFD